MLVLFAVNRAPDGVPSKTHYQKIIYLILKALKNDPKTGAGFRPHHFGPYSAMVDSWRDELLITGYLVKNTNERIWIDPTVKEDVDKIEFKNELTGMKIGEIVKFICSLSYDELLLCIYADDVQRGEGMSENSEERDRIFRDRINIALKMANAGKISVARGAELADMDVVTFMNRLKGKAECGR